MSDAIDATRRSWNLATKNHNAHKGDQARAFAEGFGLVGFFPAEALVFAAEVAVCGGFCEDGFAQAESLYDCGGAAIEMLRHDL